MALVPKVSVVIPVYNVDIIMENLPYEYIRWIENDGRCKPENGLDSIGTCEIIPSKGGSVIVKTTRGGKLCSQIITYTFLPNGMCRSPLR